ncbi:MAG: hypothetical protein VR69_01930 [Peptococcaceae bacterium BRH_c4b]|nr:MAG: hypothetical protein VR69_01930 [Peptococcaceae bacterium BRH_c4b]
MGISFHNCLVFNDCVQKVAEAQLTVAAINALTGLGIVVDSFGNATVVIGGVAIPVQFEVCCQLDKIVFRPTLLKNKIINCGWVRGALLIKNADAGNVLACVDVSLAFQEEQVANGVLPTDFIRETVEIDEGTSTCLVLVLNPTTGVVEPVVIMKCVFTVAKIVTREEVVLPSNCTALPLCVSNVCPANRVNISQT